MLARALSYGLSGVSGFKVMVEVYAANGMPSLDIIGLPDASVKESRDRVQAAITNSGFAMPIARLTVNLAPADVKKEGPAFDLPIAVSILASTRQLPETDMIWLRTPPSSSVVIRRATWKVPAEGVSAQRTFWMR